MALALKQFNLVLHLFSQYLHIFIYCQTPNLVLGLGVDFTFPYNNKNNKNNNNNNNNNIDFKLQKG